MPEKEIKKTRTKIAQKIGWIILRPILKFFTRYRLQSQTDIGKLPSPLIIVSNHTCYLDPPLIGTILPLGSAVYPAYFMTKDSIMAAPFFGGFFNLFGAFRARKGEGLEKSLEEPKKILGCGCSVVIFPQGGLSHEFAPEQGKPGAAALSLQTNIPILPVAICGIPNFSWKNFFLRKYRIEIKIGRPMLLKERLNQNYVSDENFKIATQVMMGEIKKLMG
ncbi:MAG: 1-acyl-sn-glycerol-3-phosphate acyltransferase [Candidatus Portnoybacteria bacterium]|nr:1-acyl-sn-glycerol-3-phosphate acyltransferase [Candidatus Portnoybacteria bacterium]